MDAGCGVLVLWCLFGEHGGCNGDKVEMWELRAVTVFWISWEFIAFGMLGMLPLPSDSSSSS